MADIIQLVSVHHALAVRDDALTSFGHRYSSLITNSVNRLISKG